MVKSHTHGFSGTTGNVSNSGDTWWHRHDVNPNVVSNSCAPDGGMDQHDSADYGYLTNTMNRGSWFDVSSRGRNIVNGTNLQHTHPFVGTTDSNNTAAGENRPVNYTIRVWKRTA